MDKQAILTAIIAAVPGLLLGAASLWIALKKTPSEILNSDADAKKKKAERDDLYQQIADRWAEHVEELQNTLAEERKEYAEKLENVQLDINQVRRENESYRIELRERDEIIESLKDWADRLTKQVIKHAPHIIPEKYFRRRQDAEQPSKD